MQTNEPTQNKYDEALSKYPTRLDDAAIGADGHAGSHDHKITRRQLRRAYADFLIAFNLLRGFRNCQQRVNELVFRTCARVILKRFSDIKQKHGFTCRLGVALEKRHPNRRCIEHRHIQTTATDRTERVFEEVPVAPCRPSSAKRKRSEQLAHHMEADKRRKIEH